MSEKRKNSRTSWAKTDAQAITREVSEEMPEWPDDAWDRAEIAIGGKVIRPATGTLTRGPGRPKAAISKKSVHMRLSPDVLDYFRSSGPGWQTRIDEALRKAARLGARKS
jgi:uncharacterized protein (DUF4415 family)